MIATLFAQFFQQPDYDKGIDIYIGREICVTKGAVLQTLSDNCHVTIIHRGATKFIG